MAVPKPYLRADEEIRQGLKDYHSMSLDDRAEQPCTRLDPEFDGNPHFISSELSDEIAEEIARNRGLEEEKQIEYPLFQRQPLLYHLIEPSEVRVFSDLSEKEAVEWLNLAYGFHRDSPGGSLHSGEHNIERNYQPW